MRVMLVSRRLLSTDEQAKEKEPFSPPETRYTPVEELLLPDQHERIPDAIFYEGQCFLAARESWGQTRLPIYLLGTFVIAPSKIK